MADPVAAELAAIREREQKATPGPWALEVDHDDSEYGNGGAFPYCLRLPEPHTERTNPGDEPRYYDFAYSELADFTVKTAEFMVAARSDVPRLLAAVEAVLELHQPGRIVVLGSLCKHHESHRYFSITSTEAAGVAACADCTATVYHSCAGCGDWVQWDQCPVRTAISHALLGKEAAHG